MILKLCDPKNLSTSLVEDVSEKDKVSAEVAMARISVARIEAQLIFFVFCYLFLFLFLRLGFLCSMICFHTATTSINNRERSR